MPTSPRAVSHSGNDLYREIILPTTQTTFKVTYWDVWMLALAENDLNLADVLGKDAARLLKAERRTAKRKILDKSPQDREKSPWMIHTPRVEREARALRGYWDRFPISPVHYADALTRLYKTSGYYSEDQSFGLEQKLGDFVDRKAERASLPELFALHRAFLTIVLEKMDMVDDSYGVIEHRDQCARSWSILPNRQDKNGTLAAFAEHRGYASSPGSKSQCSSKLTLPADCNIIQAVNNIYSSPESDFLPRWITPRLQAAVREHRVVVLTGARQVGKSTLLRRADPFADWRYYTFDDYDVLRQAKTDPQSLWAGTSQIVLDEVQKVPALLAAIKRAVDASRGTLHFVLSGSANLLLMRQVSESLAGRAAYFALQPMTIGEINRRPLPSILEDLLSGALPSDGTVAARIDGLVPLLLRGLMPALLQISTPTAWVEWWEGYVATYLERDLRQISQIDALSDFRRVMELLALRTGQLLNQSEAARDAKLSQPTIHRYLNLLEATYLLQRLPAFTASRTTRLLKSPKIQWADPGLATYLAGYFDETSLAHARELGCFFETFVMHHLRVLADLLTPRGRLFFWRTLAGKEVDVVIEQGQRLVALEITMSEKVSFADADGLRLFLEEHPKTASGAIVYRGQEIRRLGDRIVALPLALLLGL